MEQNYYDPLVIAQGFKGQTRRFKIAIQVNGECGSLVCTAPDEKGATTSAVITSTAAAAIIIDELDSCDLIWPLELRMFNTQEAVELLKVKCEEYILDLLLERELDYCARHDTVHPVLDIECPICDEEERMQLEELYRCGGDQPETGVSG